MQIFKHLVKLEENQFSFNIFCFKLISADNTRKVIWFSYLDLILSQLISHWYNLVWLLNGVIKLSIRSPSRKETGPERERERDKYCDVMMKKVIFWKISQIFLTFLKLINLVFFGKVPNSRWDIPKAWNIVQVVINLYGRKDLESASGEYLLKGQIP